LISSLTTLAITDQMEKTLAEQEHAGAGHNSAAQREEVVWERWTKKRTFVRALEGTYGELVRELFNQPRVYPTSDHKWKGGPGHYGKKIINHLPVVSTFREEVDECGRFV
jgi:hypothetical protein